MEGVLPTRGLAGPLHREHLGERVDVARKGAPPVAEEATAAVGQPLALADRNAGREGLAATRRWREAPEGIRTCGTDKPQSLSLASRDSSLYTREPWVRRYKGPLAAIVPSTRDRCAARAGKA